MRKYNYILFLWIVCLSCIQEGIYFYNENNYDVILLIGQSNTFAGAGLDSELDAPNKFIKQLGRFNNNNKKIIKAIDPLENHQKIDNRIGFAMTFAKKYVNEFLENGRKVLIIPCGQGASGFNNNRWNKGDDLYEDAVYRTNLILNGTSNSKLVAIIWHQGETDTGDPNYKNNLDTFINDIRNDLNNSSVPFILGGMVPYWVNLSQEGINQQKIISETPNRIFNTGYANPNLPFLIEKPNNERSAIHYDSDGMRELGERYYREFNTLKKD